MSAHGLLEKVRRISVAAILVVVFAAPLGVLALQATSTGWFFPRAWPSDVTMQHVSGLLRTPETRDALVDGALIGALVTVLALVLAWPAAQVLARPRLQGRAVVLSVLLLPSLLPAVGLAIGLDVVALRVGVAGSVFGVVAAHLVPVLPYVTVTLTAGFARHDRMVEAQAAVLGASDRQRLLLVALPAMRSSIAVAAALGFVVSWSQYLLTVLVGSGKVITTTTLLFSALAGGNPTRIGGLALLTAVPAVVVLVVAGTRARSASLP